MAQSNAQKKNAPLNAAEIADKRRTEAFGEQNMGESIKRSRTNYAESLRKKRMEEQQRAKRQNLTQTTNSQATNVQLGAAG